MITPTASSETGIAILIIEDNLGDQLLLETHLESTGLSIATINIASTIAEGITLLQNNIFSLIFLDFFLPDSNGLDSYLELAKINSRVPVVILSGLSDTALSIKAISLGAQDFLLKGGYTTESLEKCVSYSIERKRNLVLLKENNERYDVISKATQDIVWDWNLVTDKVKWFGQGLINYLPAGIEIENIPDNFWVDGLHPVEKKRVIDSLYRTITQNENSWEYDYRFLRIDGTYAYINSRGYVLKNEDGKPNRVIGSMQDITERKNAELETQKARFEAEEARKTQEQFLANMSHEIRTPMNGVIGMANLLAETNLNQDQKEYVATIKESADNLMGIINDILDLTKIVSGKLLLVETAYSLPELILNINKVYQPKANEKGIILKSTTDKKIAPVLCGDAERLSQILVNLVGNAIKFTHEGKVVVDVVLLEENEQAATLQFSVTDTGIGIEKSKIETIFERFIQVSGNSTRKYGGTGLGLTITRQLIELQGGTIHVKSKEGEGSSFVFNLTIKKGKSHPHPAHLLALPERPCNLQRIDILLVEDNIINQKVAAKSLTNLGATVHIANNGKEAIEFLKIKNYHVILMDIQMPEMDGYEATKIIRTEMQEPASSIPIIAMTASALIADRDNCLAAGMNDHIAKPFNARELCEKVIAHTGNRHGW